ncbi:MAG TPA: hypothetical protein VME70_16030 [Mycobacteriales bacterium]|nr:hypothetical protein [Mycobacteriales bacterium]
MTTTPVSLFEREMRSQIASARAAVTRAAATGEQDLIDAAQDHLDDLLALARRNGLEPEHLEPVDLTDHGPAVVLP